MPGLGRSRGDSMKIGLRVSKEWSANGKTRVKVDAEPTPCPGLVLTPSLASDGLSKDRFTLTHKATGVAVATWMRKRLALRVAQDLADSGFNFATRSVVEHKRLWDKAPKRVKDRVNAARDMAIKWALKI
jgi:hypothetical protein